MTARAIFKAVLMLGEQRVPVKLYSAVEDKSVSFRLLHRSDHVPVKEVLVNPTTEEVVEYADSQRGFEADGARLVVLDQDELKELEPPSSREIEITRFVPARNIDYRWYDRPYYLGPDDSEDDYFALAAALARTDSEGIARWVMRNKEYTGALRLHHGYPMLVTLKHPGELLPLPSDDLRDDSVLDATQLQLAKQLIESLAAPFDPDDYEDTYRERLLELIAEKQRGGEVSQPQTPPRSRGSSDLEAALRASLKAGGADA